MFTLYIGMLCSCCIWLSILGWDVISISGLVVSCDMFIFWAVGFWDKVEKFRCIQRTDIPHKKTKDRTDPRLLGWI